MGVDMMDCVLPTRAARHGLLFRAAEPGESECNIAVRMNIKRAEYAEDQAPSTPPAPAWSAGATPAPTSATSSSPRNPSPPAQLHPQPRLLP